MPAQLFAYLHVEHIFNEPYDFQLSKPHSHKPMFKFGTVPHSHIDSTIHKYFPEMFNYMKVYNRTTVQEGLSSLLTA